MKGLLLILSCFLSGFYNNEVITTLDEEDLIPYYENEEIITVSKEEYQNGVKEDNDLFIFRQDYDYNIKKIVMIDEDSYIIIGSVDNNYHPYRTENVEDFPYIAYYETSGLVWEKILVDWGYGIVSDLVYDRNGFTVVGNYEAAKNDNDSKNSVFVARFGYDGSLKDKRDFNGERNSYGNFIFEADNFYYFVGTTYASKNDFISSGGNVSRVYVGKILKNDFSSYEISVFGNDTKNILFDAELLHNKVYIYMKFGDNGYFTSNYGGAFNALLVVDDRLEFDDYLDLTSYKCSDAAKFAIYNKQLLFMDIDSTEKNFNYLILSDKLQYLKDGRINICIDSSVISSFAIDVKENIFVACKMRKNSSNYIKLITLKDLNKVYENDCDADIDYLRFVRNIDNVFYYGGTIGTATMQKPVIKSFYEVKFFDEAVSINGVYLPSRFLSINDFNKFGTYQVFCEFDGGKDLYVLSLKKEVLPEINVINQGIYDINYVLHFNGDGFLNNEEIESGFTITSEGVYLLEVRGANLLESKFYTFEVKKCSLKLVESTKEVTTVSLVPALIENSVPEEKIDLSFTPLTSYNDDYMIYIVLSLFVLGIALGILIPSRRKKHA